MDSHPAQTGRQRGLPEDVEGVQDGEMKQYRPEREQKHTCVRACVCVCVCVLAQRRCWEEAGFSGPQGGPASFILRSSSSVALWHSAAKTSVTHCYFSLVSNREWLPKCKYAICLASLAPRWLDSSVCHHREIFAYLLWGVTISNLCCVLTANWVYYCWRWHVRRCAVLLTCVIEHAHTHTHTLDGPQQTFKVLISQFTIFLIKKQGESVFSVFQKFVRIDFMFF